MPTFQEVMDQQQAEQRRAQIMIDKQLSRQLAESLQELERRENAAKQVLDLTKDCPEKIWERRSATTALEKFSRQRSAIEDRIAWADHRVKLAEALVAQLEQPLQRSGKIRELLRQVAP